MTDNQQQPNRREFAKKVRKGVVVAGLGAAGVAGIGHATRFIWDPLEFEPLGNKNHPVRQQDVNKLYETIYNEIRDAKVQADEQSKELVILTGENHKEGLSGLQNLLILDAAYRQQIRTLVVETDETQQYMDGRIEKTRTRQARDINRIKYDSEFGLLPGKYQEWIAEHTKTSSSNSSTIQEQLVRLLILQGANLSDAVIKMQGEEESTGSLHEYDFTSHNDFRVIDGDPNFEFSDDCFSDVIEKDGILPALMSVNGHRVANYGLLHIPFLMEELKQDENILPLIYDVSNGLRTGTDPSWEGQRRDHYLKNHADEITKHVLDGKSPGAFEANTLALTASIVHRRDHAELSDHLPAEEANFYVGMIKAVSKAHQQVRAGGANGVSR